MLNLDYILGVRKFLDDTAGYVPPSSRQRRRIKLRLAYYENPDTGDVVIARKSRDMLKKGFKEISQ